MTTEPSKGRGADGARSPKAPLRLQVSSDWHADVRAMTLPHLAPDADVVVVAGDVRQGPLSALHLLRLAFPEPVPIVFVLGNHEFYRTFHPSSLALAREGAPDLGITLLEDSAAVIEGVRFVGATFWTDYRLDGGGKRAAAMAAALASMNDHRVIGWSKAPWTRFTPEHADALHAASSRFIADALAEPFGGPSVVVTHHAPSPLSVHPRYEGDPLNAAFASDKGDLVEAGKPALWVHGHVHTSFDYRVGATRVVANPHGYGTENPGFDPSLVVEVAR